MVPFFPRQIANRAILVYAISVIIVSALYFSYAMPLMYLVIGIVSVTGFFLLTSNFSIQWRNMPNKQFVYMLFGLAVGLRLVWLIGSYYYYIETNEIPFDKDAADALGYHNEAQWLSGEPWDFVFTYYLTMIDGISDMGYSLYLTCLYRIVGPVIIIPRIIKTLLGAWTAYLIYKLAARTFDENTGRMAGLMAALMPNLIIYCGYHLKEVDMLFLETAFLERMDYLLRVKKYNIWTISVPLILAGSLFCFRTVLGLAAVFAFVTSVVFSASPTMKKGWKRTVIIGWSLLAVGVAAGGTAVTEIQELWEHRSSNAADKRADQAANGNNWALYATGSVMAPMVVSLPFATMIHIEGQEIQMTKHGGNYVRNFMAFFALVALYEAIRQRKWRDFSLVLAFTFAYLGVISLSGFSNSERFLLPGLPGLCIIWAYGVSQLNAKSYKFFTPWCVIVVFIEVGWAFFKLGSRGL